MKKIIFPILAMVGFLCFCAGAMVQDMGKTKPSYVVGWDMLFTLLMFGTIFFLGGYFTRKYEKED